MCCVKKLIHELISSGNICEASSPLCLYSHTSACNGHIVEVCFTVLLSVISYTVLCCAVSCCVALCRVVLHCVVGIEQCCVVLFHSLCCVVLHW